MKLRNKLIKTVTLDSQLKSKISLYANYKKPDETLTRYVMTDVNDILVCNKGDIDSYSQAGFVIFGRAETESELQEIVALAEIS
ncbi:hypothetical protein [Paenibacillus silvae]|uniref:Uncharacterized protein n=1 Tax=Paenibacillus silvae TaxID=1325358 RepID=A0A2W6NQA3_9BACL|nr:hypothetical protein [Paenibacillus silvae]PZT57448.1 hypothetical protein DN757_01985 [Paenibacillus silvae]